MSQSAQTKLAFSTVADEAYSVATGNVIDAANEKKLPYSLRRLTRDALSPADLADQCECEASQVLQTVFYRGKISIKPSLMLAPGDKTIDERKIYNLIGDVLVRAEENLVIGRTGFAPAVLPPLGFMMRIPVVMDELLLRHTHLWCFAGDSRVAISFPSEKLAFALSARIAKITA